MSDERTPAERYGVPATFPLPAGYALCCPRCGVWKMRRDMLNGEGIWRCSGPVSAERVKSAGYTPGFGFAICGHVFSDLEIRSFIGLRMVQE